MTRVVIHADDLGMCHGANRAFAELSRCGAITAGSVMAPCPWFTEIAEIAAGDGRLDCGVHLTITSEMRHYRWGPLTRAGRASGLTDGSGYLWPRVEQVRRRAHPEAVEAEWRAQIDRALDAGIDVTHLDAHMGAALAPEWCDRYLSVGLDYGLVVLLTPTLRQYGAGGHLGEPSEGPYRETVAEATAAGMPLFSTVLETDFSRPRHERPDYKQMLSRLGEGLAYCAFHPCAPGGAEIEVIEPTQHHVRLDEYELFSKDSWQVWLAEQPFSLTGMRDLRDEWRARALDPNGRGPADGSRPATRERNSQAINAARERD